MSFSKSLNNAINNYISAVAVKYSLNEDELKQIWNGEIIPSPKSAATPPSTPASTSNLSATELSKLKNSELAAHCKARGLKTTGTKQELVDRLLNVGGAAAAAAVVPTTPKKKEKETPSVAPKLAQSTIQTVQIKKNSFGNFEHSESGLVFDKVTQKVIGKQNKDGTVKSLTDEDIDTCNKYKFKYVIPENLNANTKTNVAIEGLEEEEETSTTDVINEAEDVLAAEEEEEELEEEEEELVEETFEDDE